MKPIHVKPSLYAYYFLQLKEIALHHGYNLVIHGSLNRDLDLIAIPWQEELKPHGEMIARFAECLGGHIMSQEGKECRETYHGRIHYVIDINRGGYKEDGSFVEDPQYYLDISVTPAVGQTK